MSQPDEKSVVGVVNTLLEEAASGNVSDIHIEPMKDRVRVRFRLDGVLVHHRDLPLQMGPPITSRLKIMSKADIAERGAPGRQDRIRGPADRGFPGHQGLFLCDRMG